MDQQQLLTQLIQFFPDDDYSLNNLDQYIEAGELEIDEDTLAGTLKGALLDESIVEVELDDLKNVFFCRILDNPFGNSDEEYDDEERRDSGYENGSYLDEYGHLIITPLEPAMGNYLISANKTTQTRMVLRIVASGVAIEFGCFFQQRTYLDDMPVLQLTFPLFAKKISGSREFRAKVPSKMNFQVVVERIKKSRITTRPINISLSGMALIDPMGRRTNLQVGEEVVCELQIVGEEPVLAESKIIHVTRLRNSTGVQYCFGLNFNLTRPDVKASIEKLVAVVQRKHLQELSNLEERFGITILK